MNENDDLLYWQRQLEAVPESILIPGTYRRRVQTSYAASQIAFELGPEVVKNLNAFRRTESTSIPATLLAVQAAMLHRYTGHEDIVIGVRLTDRTVPIRLRLEAGANLPGLAAQAAETIQAAADHATISIPELAAALLPDSEPGRPPFFETMLIRGAGRPEYPVDLAISFHDAGESLSCTLHYNTNLFDEAAANRFAGHYRTLLQHALDEPEKRLIFVEMLTRQERERQIQSWNDTAAPFPSERCLHQLFEENHDKNPQAQAVFFRDERLSYQVVEERANQLAHHLHDLGIGPQVRVGLCVERTVDLPVAILAILKAGGCYVPLDPAYPRSRLDFMISDARAAVLVTRQHLRPLLASSGARIVCLDEAADDIGRQPIARPVHDSDPENLAYIIYTSGSTGRPKGIALRHSGVANNIWDLNHSYGVGSRSRVICISSLSFDMCVYEILGTLAAGGTIVLPEPERGLDPLHWAELVTEHGVTVWNSAPQLLKMLVEAVEPRPSLHPVSVRTVFQGGDWEPVSLPDRLRALSPQAQVVVLGGATELSIHSVTYPVSQVDPGWPSIPYGRPMQNQTAFILDKHLNLCPIGVPGELHLGGIGMAQGYFGQPRLTAEKFIPNPFPAAGMPAAGEQDEEAWRPHWAYTRLYKTGDLARYLPDGTIELLGRIDHLVKIRGNRIELGEITARLKEHPLVRESLLAVREDRTGERELVAYVVPEHENRAADLSQAALSQWRAVYDETYAQSSPKSGPAGDFAGWVNSYDGEPFSEAELLEMVDRSAECILGLGPQRVLELGCGTGLVTFRVAPHTEHYLATDFSAAAVDYVRRRLESSPDALPQVSTARRMAHERWTEEAGRYDTIILNSVSQHFPNISYALEVVESALELLQPGGALYFGDVRSYPLMRAFHMDIEFHHADGDGSLDQLRERVRSRRRRERELFIEPDFFYALNQRFTNIDGALVQPKQGRHENEFNRFHFDVLIWKRSGDGSRPPPSTEPATAGSDRPARSATHRPMRIEWRANEADISWLGEKLAAARPLELEVYGIPNQRLTRVMRLLEMVDDAKGTPTEIRTSMATPAAGVHPDDVLELGEALGYRTSLFLPPGSPADRMAARFSLTDGPADRIRELGRPVDDWTQLANVPMQAEETRGLAPQLREFLEAGLPAYMVPQVFVFLDALPLNPNGKVDRGALPPPPQSRPQLQSDYIAPQGALQEMLAGIWSEVLGFSEIGVADDFFELGGHSLTATQVVGRVRENLQVTVPLRTLFENPTIAGMVEQLAALGAVEGTDVEQIAALHQQVGRLSDAQAAALLEEEQ